MLDALLRTVTFSYSSREDRVLAALNVGQPDAWSCWITRRLALAVIEGAAKFLASTSPLAKRAASAHQRELAQFERQSAMASTAKALSVSSKDELKASATAAELAERVTLTNQGERFRLECLLGSLLPRRALTQRNSRCARLRRQPTRRFWMALSTTTRATPRPRRPGR